MDLVVRIIHYTNPFYIYLIVGVALLLESGGIPIVNSTLLLLTGALAALGHLNIFALILVSIIGSVAGACLAYVIGSRGGAHLARRAASRLHIDARKVRSVEGWFHQSGARMIFLSRIIPYIRPFACYPAGMSRMPFRRFFAAVLVGSIIWCVTIPIIGWNLGRRWRLALSLMQTYTIPTVLVIILLVVTYVLVALALKRRLRARLQAAADGEANVEGQSDYDLIEV